MNVVAVAALVCFGLWVGIVTLSLKGRNRMKTTLYELINPSDAYTFRAPSLEVAGVCACLLSTGFGAKPLEGDSDETTPVLFGWSDWLTDRGINDDWIDAHALEIADAYDSFLIGSQRDREDVESMLAELPEEKREEWRAKRQDRHRSSMNQIGERAYQLAKRYRAHAAKLTPSDS